MHLNFSRVAEQLMTGVVIKLPPYLLLFGGLEGRDFRSVLKVRNICLRRLIGLSQRLDVMRF
jgi:hypothetical protein